jgi:hypothetical protein
MHVGYFFTLINDFGFLLFNNQIAFQVVEHAYIMTMLFARLNEATGAVEFWVSRENYDVHAEKSCVEGNTRAR